MIPNGGEVIVEQMLVSEETNKSKEQDRESHNEGFE